MQLGHIETLLEQALSPLCDGSAPLGVAVSGGGDSMALLHALAARRAAGGGALQAVTVDHGLRPEAAAEAQFVAETCARLGVPHDILHWTGWQGRGNLQDAARRARQRLIADWAAAKGIARVALGHTRDDQAETVLMRLGRGAGVDGLSGMAPMRTALGVVWLRPFLDTPRAVLRRYLSDHGQAWVEDPSNDDLRFDRVQARRALEMLAPLGVTAEGLAATAARLADARQALSAVAAETADRIAHVDRGDVLIDAAGLAALPGEIARRLINAALCWVASAEYPPRADALGGVFGVLESSGRATLHGCLIDRGRTHIRIAREYAAVRGTVCVADRTWDGRWTLTGPAKGDEEVRALGETGLARSPDWRAVGLPRASLLASPALWRGEELIAAPLAGLSNGWTASVSTLFIERLVAH
ncbi:tRNA(Ile)-lysidine synthetase [Rhodovulum sp. P5]|uniref:tRNA lysidine(34) synthetase TilS n=1 Tax=Rhodovulum sp. P5 TaxID=1564506 RepID=UPI0009C34C90|nr:tRNA lysidine(34) synthetase TilS [Rhodovulum sp. P5]ARE39795.1 tRNA(Ile)-lysidine synthetase [Rhodovulum sp. P5]